MYAHVHVALVCTLLLLLLLQLFAKLATTVTILDTSPCKPRRSFFLNDARSQFQETVLSLSCVADVERYWFDLQLICQQTPIILGRVTCTYMHLVFC